MRYTLEVYYPDNVFFQVKVNGDSIPAAGDTVNIGYPWLEPGDKDYVVVGTVSRVLHREIEVTSKSPRVATLETVVQARVGLQLST